MNSEPETSGEMAFVVRRNIKALITQREDEERQKGWQESLADKVTQFTGSLTFVWIHLAVFGGWVVMNLPMTPFPKWDPTFVVLAMVASVEAIFLSTFVLISQNRMAEMQNRRADLDLQISLLAEHEVTQLVTLVRRVAQQMGIEEADDPKLAELEQDVPPEKVLKTMEEVSRGGGGV
ncbi:MAG TPA: DUF1003 domain-containing protein [Prosthecobacter sp.]|nr:DUF1003 domain-containing protein [Prosthecobacter sp.]